MSKIISATERPLSAIFNKQYDFVIPPYQRPYAWTVDEAGELFDDLHGFHQQFVQQQSPNDIAVIAPYFLGNIVLIKEDEEKKPMARVVDGQQRLTTLTILLAAMASRMPAHSEERGGLENYVCEPGHRIEKRKPKPRLALRERDQKFFEQSIQQFDFEWLAKQVAANDAQRNIQANGDLFLRLLLEKFPDTPEGIVDMSEFASTIMMNCYLVAVSTPNEQSAFRIFTVLNTRGLDLLPTDILKASIVGAIPNNMRDEYSQKWEQLEEMVGRSGFHNLFEYMRMIRVKDKARRSLLEEFKENVLNKMSVDMKTFIDGDLSSYATAYHIARKGAYQLSNGAKDDAASVNKSLYWLNRIDNSDWLPSAILFLKQKQGDAKYAAWFFRKLERLAAFQHICARNINQRIARYARIISAMEKEHSMEAPIENIELTDNEKQEMKSALDGEIYGQFYSLRPLRRNYAILRLDSFIADEGAEYDRSHLTIEHVLPQTVTPGSEWAKTWPDEHLRHQWVGRIANLVPLNRKRNAAASNYDFCKKKDKYFSRGAAPYVLTSQVLLKNQWTPEVVQERQKELLRIYAEQWELN